jgi:hypothetical protein
VRGDPVGHTIAPALRLAKDDQSLDAGIPGSLSRLVDKGGNTVTINRAPESRIWKAILSAVYSGLSVVTIPPADALPWNATGYSGRFDVVSGSRLLKII